MKSRSRYIKLSIFAIIAIVFDQVSKIWAINTLKDKADIDIIKDILCLHYLDGGNKGAAWGLLSGKIALFVIFSIIAVIIILMIVKNINDLIVNSLTNVKILGFLQYLLILLASGAVGNLIDRVIRGYVVDFIYFKLIDFPIFNVADIYVTCSCALIILVCFIKLDENQFNQIFTLKRKIKHDK